MTRPALPAALALTLLLTACAVPRPAPPPAAPPAGQLELKLPSGTYGCELGVRIDVDRAMRDRVNYRVDIAWNGRRYRLDRDPSYSGIPRFEDRANGLVWLDLPTKSLLLDSRADRPLANECRPV